jgi:hypothetical protein
MSVCVSFGGWIFPVSQKKTPGEGLKYIPAMEESPVGGEAGGICIAAGGISEMY